MRVLEVGCGRGATLLNLVSRGALGAGVDYAESAIEFCKELQCEAGLENRSEFICADAFDLPFEAGKFDVVYSIGLIEHFESPERILAQQFRVLKPGGYLIVQAPQKYSPYTIFKQLLIRMGRWRYGIWETQFSQRELDELTKSVGFQPQYACGYGSFVLALLRHFFLPNLDFDGHLRMWDTRPLLRTLKTHIALDVCVVARKPLDR
jgi:ubiquinone/menaquinone biosynthesis C-methylase UbiE